MIIRKNINARFKNKASKNELSVFLLTYNFYYSITNEQAS